MRKSPFSLAQKLIFFSTFFLACSGVASDFCSHALLTPLQKYLLEGFVVFEPCPINQGVSSRPHEKVILDFQAQHKICAWNWLPMQETRPGGDPVNNLYAKDGCLDKLDKVTGGTARQYEFEHNRKEKDEGKQYAWWGHCNNAVEAACLLPGPKKGVAMRAKNSASTTLLQESLLEGFVGFGLEIEFSKNDIQGLLLLMSSSLVSGVDFFGGRRNSNFFEDQGEEKPEHFLKVIKKWSAVAQPFVMDIDRGEHVWNYPYDQIKITESDKAPVGFDSSSLARDESVKYYHIEMSGTGYDDNRRVYDCYVHTGSDGHVITSGWIKTPKTHGNPDFMWRPHPIPDLMNEDNWVLRGRPSNPMINPKVIYAIYMKSLQ